ncbi:MAG: sigma-54-dependent Fis family transcriptional regulator [Deltaproteobacteria bacterium]|nr:sigma-54-dependent Fis family transcriptional regulator [Deltaproteobacteria bacterium]
MTDPVTTPAQAPFTVLVVDDERGIVDSLATILEREGLTALKTTDPKQALEILRKQRISVLITDLMMPGMSGMDLLKAARAIASETEVIVMTAYGTVENAVDAMKEGAYDFLTKPLKRASVVRIIKKALEKQSLVLENRSLRAELERARKRSIVGSSLAMRRVLEVVSQAAPSTATVLLLGESGTGKELLARAIHDRSPRAGKPFVPVNCAAIPEGILEAELFGYDRGAFTGAVARRDGRFISADGGTLFLDEIGEIPSHIQVKLLRVLQEGEVERLGGRSQRVDLRLVAATNKDLARAVREGRFREDLYYRLNVIALTVPPLRDRKDDVPLLVEHFLQVFRARNGKAIAGLSRGALDLLQSYDWPGNVRELENAIERAVVLCKGTSIDSDDLPLEVRGGGGAGLGLGGASGARVISFPTGTPLEEIERRAIHETLKHAKGDKRLAAQLLGIATRTIYRKLEAEGIASDAADAADAGAGAGEDADRDSADVAAADSDSDTDSGVDASMGVR